MVLVKQSMRLRWARMTLVLLPCSQITSVPRRFGGNIHLGQVRVSTPEQTVANQVADKSSALCSATPLMAGQSPAFPPGALPLTSRSQRRCPTPFPARGGIAGATQDMVGNQKERWPQVIEKAERPLPTRCRISRNFGWRKSRNCHGRIRRNIHGAGAVDACNFVVPRRGMTWSPCSLHTPASCRTDF
jgi:hypothetical protein